METQKPNKPKADAFRQQKLSAWQPIMTPLKVVVIFLSIGVVFIPTGFTLLGQSNDIYEKRMTYDGIDSVINDCTATSTTVGKTCDVTISIDEDVDGPIYVYYEIDNFYQNHRIYVSSRDAEQLNGKHISKGRLEESCQKEITKGGLILHPCGLIANSFFNDTFTLRSAESIPTTVTMDETDIAWSSDRAKFHQPDGFQVEPVASATATCASVGLPDTCAYYEYQGQGYLFSYPREDTTHYLYESYPMINPILGVRDEHFMVWMRTAALPDFRKLYGRIDGNFVRGDLLNFTVAANFPVQQFDGTKRLVLSTVDELGGRNPYIGVAYITVGCISLMFALLFTSKQLISPRAVADPSLLNWT